MLLLCRDSDKGGKLPMLQVMEHHPNNRTLQNYDITFDFVYASFQSMVKDKYNSEIIDPSIHYSIGCKKYYQCCITNKERFWETDFLITFSTLQSISLIDNEIIFLDNNKVNNNPQYVTDKKSTIKKLSNDVESIVSVVSKITFWYDDIIYF